MGGGNTAVAGGGAVFEGDVNRSGGAQRGEVAVKGSRSIRNSGDRVGVDGRRLGGWSSMAAGGVVVVCVVKVMSVPVAVP